MWAGRDDGRGEGDVSGVAPLSGTGKRRDGNDERCVSGRSRGDDSGCDMPYMLDRYACMTRRSGAMILTRPSGTYSYAHVQLCALVQRSWRRCSTLPATFVLGHETQARGEARYDINAILLASTLLVTLYQPSSSRAPAHTAYCPPSLTFQRLHPSPLATGNHSALPVCGV